MKTIDLIKYLDELLRTTEIEDDSLNGLQVENSGTVQKVALAVDVSEPAIQKAAEIHADMLLVHHGLFWGKSEAITGGLYKRIHGLIQNNIALYASHLPLDMHPDFGNNAQMVSLMDWKVSSDFGLYHGYVLGKEIRFEQGIPVQKIVDDLSDKLNCETSVWAFGNDNVRTAAYVSGGAISMLPEAIEKGLDLYITGEPRHGSYWLAKEAGINVIFAGHYATETLGVKALGEHLKKQFGLDVEMIDFPTGL